MELYREMYLVIFRAVTQAIEEMDQMNFGTARALLVQAQLDAEEIYCGDGHKALAKDSPPCYNQKKQQEESL